MSAARHVRRFARAVAVGGLLAYAAGSVTSLLRLDPDLFHRFGALGVAAAVLFFNDRLLRIELARQLRVERLLHEYGLELEVLKSGTDPREMPREGYVIDFLTEERGFGQLRTVADRVQAANIVLLTVSTLQWGFGDLFLSAVAGEAA